MHADYLYIHYGPCSGQKRCVFAYTSCPSTPSEAGIHYCTSDGTALCQESIVNIDLKYPFNAINLTPSDDEYRARHLRILVLYYFLAKKHVESIELGDSQLSKFRKVYANAAELKENDAAEASASRSFPIKLRHMRKAYE